MPALRLAQSFLSRGDLLRAENETRNCIATSPSDPRAYELLASVLNRQGRPLEATEALRKALQFLPGQPDLLNSLGNSLAACGNYADAEPCYRQALKARSDFAQAHYNLGLMLMKTSRPADAVQALEAARNLQPNSGSTHEALSQAYKELGNANESVSSALRAVELLPRSFRSHYCLGQAYMLSGDFGLAANAYRQALALNDQVDALWIGFGHALRAMGQAQKALDAYKRALNANASNADAHRLVNELLWQTGNHHSYLSSYAVHLRQVHDDPPVRKAFAAELLKVQNFDDALRQLELLPDDWRASSDVLCMQARAHRGKSDFEAAVRYHEASIKANEADPSLSTSFVESLLLAGLFERAHAEVLSGLARFPFDQAIMSMYTVSHRLAGAPDDLGLCRSTDLVRSIDIAPPSGYSDIESFCADLSELLNELHGARQHPTDQTLRNGTQTFGALFQVKHPLIIGLKQKISEAVTSVMHGMPRGTVHKVYSRANRRHEFSGSWSVRLNRGGFHTNHFHPMGWLSSAFYVQVPQDMDNHHQKAGWFKYGETYLDLGDKETIEGYIEPKVGRLVLFPSYYWHGTVPFNSDIPRITVAFDVVPGK